MYCLQAIVRRSGIATLSTCAMKNLELSARGHDNSSRIFAAKMFYRKCAGRWLRG
jgi:hypothetical protein